MDEKEDTYYPANDDILGGLRAAIEKGETLKEAMMSFYNAGYAKNEIEEAARDYLIEKSEGELIQGVVQKMQEPVKSESISEAKSLKKIEADRRFIKKPQPLAQVQKVTPAQKVSNYGDAKKSKKRIDPITIILVLLLVFLVLVLGAVFMFKEQLVIFFNSLFG